ncbi:uncharacterized protein LOC131152797 [Malania oleifera]|uniref:uncharacterized protein LOC131152797 n=1 Tax=Malania oleifera TaxID=397392 RepID=UPI0025ADF38B|nr:uncharacterized protein LOC131152797 [Malania oleifera]
MESVVPKFSHATESGNSHSIKARQTAINVPKHDIANHLQGYKCAREQRGSYSDLQMHPLLFQAPENGCLPYYPLNCCTGVPASFNFTSGNQPLLNLSLSHISRRANPAVNYLNKSLKSKRSGSALGGIDFHPLLQRTNDINGTSVSGVPSAQLSVNLESFRGEAAEMGNPSDTVPSMLQTNSDQLAASDKLFNPLEKENELDLEIHLSSTSSRKETAVGNVSVIDYNLERSIVSVPNSRTTMETGNCSSPCDQNGENCPAASMPNRTDAEHVSGAYGTSMPSNDISEYCIDNINDQSLPEIVMEQEELSDSDDEVGENVEFECEEMADSEGAEGSDSEQMANIQNKEASNVAVEKVVADADVDDQQAEPIIRGNHENNDSLPLDCVDESKHVESRNGKSLAGKNAASSRPKRSCRKITRSAQNVSRQQHPVYTPKHLAPASLSTTPLRKPRKCARRTEAILS